VLIVFLLRGESLKLILVDEPLLEVVLSQSRRSGMVTSAGGEAALERGKRGDDDSWADVNLTWSKNEKKSTRSIQLLQMDDEDLKQR
jgi:hypothetical protein